MDSALRTLAERVDTISKWATWAGGALVMASAILLSVQIVARKLFDFSIIGADELSGYALGISMTWGYAYVLFRRAHLRIDALYSRLPPKVCRWLDAVSLVIFSLLIGFLTYRAYAVLHETISRDVKSSTALSVSLWIPQTPWFLGLCFFEFCLLLVTARVLLALSRGDYELVQKIAAAPSVADEIDEQEATPDLPAPV